MKFRKKPIVIDAEQWQPGKVIEGVQEIKPELLISQNGRYYYLSALSELRADAWLPVNELDGENLPFAFYECKVGERRLATADDPLTQRYLAHLKATALPPSYGIVETLEGRMTCLPGDWVITGVKGEKYPCKPDIFEATYEPAE